VSLCPAPRPGGECYEALKSVTARNEVLASALRSPTSSPLAPYKNLDCTGARGRDLQLPPTFCILYPPGRPARPQGQLYVWGPYVCLFYWTRLDIMATYDFQTGLSGAASGAAAGSTIAPGIGTAIGGALGLASGTLA
jgi:hypothetical protein